MNDERACKNIDCPVGCPAEHIEMYHSEPNGFLVEGSEITLRVNEDGRLELVPDVEP